MQKKLALFFLILLMTALIGCGSNYHKDMKLVSKVEIEQIISGGDIIETSSSLGEHTINSIKEIIKKINWDKKSKHIHSSGMKMMVQQRYTVLTNMEN